MKRKKRLQLLGLLLFILFAQPIIGRASGAEVYSVQFINEGKVVQTKEIPESTVLGALPTAGRKTGYQFAGWWNKGAEATPNTLITENKTYQGKWQPFTYKVKYNTPYFADWQQTSKTDEIFTLKKLTKKGYTFLGWATTQNGKVKYAGNAKVKNLVLKNKGSITLYGRWKKNTYKVTFNIAHAKDFSKTMTYDKSFKFPSMKHAEFEFLGWAVKPHGKVKYKPNTSGKNLSTGKSVTLYGVWKGKDYNVKYVSEHTTDFTRKYNVAKSLKTPNPKGKYLGFLGWATTPNGKVKYKGNAKVKNLIQHKTLYAKWKLPTIRAARATKWVKIYSGENGKVIRKIHINVGAPQFKTPLGNFQILRKVRSDYMPDADLYYGVKGVEWTSYWTPSGHAIHTASWCFQNGKWNMGQEISHGCLNMTRQDAKFVYENCPIGTPVIIREYTN